MSPDWQRIVESIAIGIVLLLVGALVKPTRKILIQMLRGGLRSAQQVWQAFQSLVKRLLRRVFKSLFLWLDNRIVSIAGQEWLDERIEAVVKTAKRPSDAWIPCSMCGRVWALDACFFVPDSAFKHAAEEKGIRDAKSKWLAVADEHGSEALKRKLATYSRVLSRYETWQRFTCPDCEERNIDAAVIRLWRTFWDSHR